MNQAQSVSATFSLKSFDLTVGRPGTGSGTVTSDLTGIDCGATCSAPYTYGSVVTLTATPASDSDSTSWTGACTGNIPTCQVPMAQAQSVSATFTRKPWRPDGLIGRQKSGPYIGEMRTTPPAKGKQEVRERFGDPLPCLHRSPK